MPPGYVKVGEYAAELLALGMSVETVMRRTGLSEARVRRIQGNQGKVKHG